MDPLWGVDGGAAGDGWTKGGAERQGFGFRNLLRDEGDHLKVADFGLSKLVNMNSLLEVYQMTGETGSCEPPTSHHIRGDTWQRVRGWGTRD